MINGLLEVHEAQTRLGLRPKIKLPESETKSDLGVISRSLK